LFEAAANKATNSVSSRSTSQKLHKKTSGRQGVSDSQPKRKRKTNFGDKNRGSAISIPGKGRD
jgi:hypothetical protein